jgi:hypothetical protein
MLWRRGTYCAGAGQDNHKFNDRGCGMTADNEGCYAANAPPADHVSVTLDSSHLGVSPVTAKCPTSRRYDLRDEIARGGMGAVYAAQDRILNREVAIKVLRDEFRSHPSHAHRFFSEGQITGQLQHPAIPPVHEQGTLPDGRPFLVMKLIIGLFLGGLAGPTGLFSFLGWWFIARPSRGAGYRLSDFWAPGGAKPSPPPDAARDVGSGNS